MKNEIHISDFLIYNQNAIKNAQFLGIRPLNMSRQFEGFSLQF